MLQGRFNKQSGPAGAVETDHGIGCVTCPLCQTLMTSATDATLPVAAWWSCTGCGQMWTAGRLLVVAAYAQYVTARATLPAGRPS